jgi:hypothetical protein
MIGEGLTTIRVLLRHLARKRVYFVQQAQFVSQATQRVEKGARR